MPTKAVFFDRDGTLIEDMNYLRDPGGVRLLPGAAASVRRLRKAGYRIIVVTNQSGLARGLFDEATLNAIHDRLRDVLAREGAAIDAIYYCPYLDGSEAVVEQYRRDSELRKPRPGMYALAAKEHGIDLAASWSIGDSDRDSEAAKAAGCRSIQLVRDGRRSDGVPADFTAASLAEAAERVLASTRVNEGDTAVVRSEKLLAEIAEHIRVWHRRAAMDDFTPSRLAGAVVQVLALSVAAWAMLSMISPSPDVFPAHRWLAAIFLQVLALTCFALSRNR